MTKRVVFASEYCLLDSSSGAALATAQCLQFLASCGFQCQAFCGARLDFSEEVCFEETLSRLGLPYEVADRSVDGRPARLVFTRSGDVPVTVFRNVFTQGGPTEAEVPAFLGAFDTFLAANRPDVLLTYGGGPLGDAISDLAKRRGIVVVFGLHNFAYHDPRAFAQVDYVVVPSQFSKDYYRAHVGVDCHVLPNAIDFDRAKALRREPEYLTFVNPQPTKGLYVVARIAEQLGRRRPDIRMLIVEGRARGKSLEQTGLDLSWATNLFGTANTTDPRQFYAVTKVLLMPSLWNESFGLVAAEAMLNGIPVLASNRGALPETVGDGGLLFNIPARYTPHTTDVPTSEEVEPWLGAILRVWDHPAFYHDQSQRALRWSERFHPDRLRSQYVDFFGSLHPQTGPTPPLPEPRASGLYGVSHRHGSLGAEPNSVARRTISLDFKGGAQRCLRCRGQQGVASQPSASHNSWEHKEHFMRIAFILAMIGAALVLTSAVSPVVVLAQTDRETIPLDRDWRFHRGDLPNAQAAQLDDSSWRRLDVPHDWSIEGAGDLANLPALNVVVGTWRFHKGDHPGWKDPSLDESDWETVKLPAFWNDHSGYTEENVYGWFRRRITIPERLKGKPFLLILGKIDDADETYLNGRKIGATGRMPPHYETAWDVVRQYKVDPKWVRAQGENVLAIRVYNGLRQGGIYETGPESVAPEGPFNPLSPARDGGGYLDGGIGWYRKTFTMPPSAKGRCVSIEFDGAYMDSDVWLNEKHLGRHPYGYTSFQYDLTPVLRWDRPNVLAVRLNVTQPCSRWYSGAGIYRHVRLTVTDPVHVAHWGTYITTPKVSADAASVRVRTRVANQGQSAADVRLETIVLDPRGAEVAAAEAAGRIVAGAESAFDQTLQVGRPRLWSIETPQLYRVISRVKIGDHVVDRYATPFGIRTFEFTRDRGFLLNGRHVPLQGVCNHHDLGCLGAAVHRRAIERQLEILKGMGCNAIRTSHNPPAPELLDLCDRMGFVVMDEAFDEWKAAKTQFGYGRFFDEWSERDLVSMLHRDRNHPCVVMWSIGNEINEQGSPNGYAMSKRLVDICHREDPTRPTISACNDPGGANRTGFAKPLDLFGINYNIGAYRQFRDRYALVASETASALSTRGEYNLVPGPDGKLRIQSQYKHQVTSYDRGAPPWGCTAETGLAAMVQARWVAGEFVWTGFDYIGEPTPYAWPARSSYFGIVDLCGFPKDRYYFYRSRWRPEPLVHLLPHWDWPGYEGKELPVWCVTNCDCVELLLNGRSLGERKLDRGNTFHVEWSVPYAAGTLKAVGKNAGQVVSTDEVRTPGKPKRLALQADRAGIAADGEDLSFVQVRVTDPGGLICPNAGHLVSFRIEGPGAIAGVDNGDPTNHEPFQSNRHKVFHGLGLAVVKATRSPGRIVLHAEADGLDPAEIALESNSGP